MPSEWKYAKITPLYKKGISTDMDNHRPISVLPFLGSFSISLVRTSLKYF